MVLRHIRYNVNNDASYLRPLFIAFEMLHYLFNLLSITIRENIQMRMSGFLMVNLIQLGDDFTLAKLLPEHARAANYIVPRITVLNQDRANVLVLSLN